MPYTYQKNADGLYVCEHCGKTTERQNTMHYHLKTHEGKLPFECSICNKQFLHSATLELHKKAQHQKDLERMFKCPVVGCPYEGTLTKSNLLIHFVRKHCKEEATKVMRRAGDAYSCQICNKEAKSLTAFHYHVATCIQPATEERKQQLAALRA